MADLDRGAESELARRIRERLNEDRDWTVEGSSKVWARKKPPKQKPSFLPDLPIQRAPLPAGVLRHGVPSRHEQTIMQRAALGYVIVVERMDGTILYAFEDGSPILDAQHKPIDERQWRRLKRFLVPDRREHFFEERLVRRWNVRRIATDTP
jgi:hypothetical protein